jgi:hypothetical protein
MRTSIFLAAVAALLLPFSGRAAVAPPSPCHGEHLEVMPSRPADAPTGTQFVQEVRSLTGPSRDSRVRSEILSGNLPGFLRRWVPVTVSSATTAPEPVRITLCALPDYLAVGSDDDFVYVPMGLEAALSVAERLGFLLPTPRLVDAIYEQSAVQLEPQPLPPGDDMRSTDYFLYHNDLIREQRAVRGVELGELMAGHKKDLVLSARLWQHPGQVAIYGWHRDAHSPIQPLSTVHGARYADYSHGVRLVSLTAYVNGVRRSLFEILADPKLASLVSSEGPLPHVGERLERLMGALQGPMTPTRQ